MFVLLKILKQEKKDKLKENIIILENLSNTFEDSINKLKEIFGKLNSNKEEMKMNIQKVFTKIRNAINEREDEIMIEVDKLFESLFIKESIIKEGEKLPNKIKKSLEKGKLLKDELNDDNNLRLFLNDCINIEYNINEIKRINDNINKCNYNDSKIKFNSEENEINKLLNKIKKFGDLYFSRNFKFIECPNNIEEQRKYIISGDNGNIVTKISFNYPIHPLLKKIIGLE